jgi:M6 family metalloprotease-like protein
MKSRYHTAAGLLILSSLVVGSLDTKKVLGADAIEACRLRETSYPRQLNEHLFTAFPPISKNLPSAGTFTLAIVPVHYSDLPAEAEPLKRVRDDMQSLVEYYELQSEGRVRFRWSVTEQSVLLPGTANELGGLKGSAAEVDYAKRVLAAVDPFVNFEGVHSAVFVLPPGSKNTNGIQLMYPMKISVPLVTSEQNIFNFLMAGTYFGNSVRPEWTYWAHELGHAFHLPDLYAQPWNPTVRNMRNFEIPGPFHGWDFMATQDGPSRTINMWLRWVRGWATDSQIHCRRASEIGDLEVDLVPVETSASGTKAVVIAFGSSRALVIESRRETKFNLRNDVIDEGVLVYEVDSSLGHGEIPLLPIKLGDKISVSPGGDRNPPYFDSLITEGQVLRYENLYIKFLKSGNLDRVRISTSELVESRPIVSTTTTVSQKPQPKGELSKQQVCKRLGMKRKVGGVWQICRQKSGKTVWVVNR